MRRDARRILFACLLPALLASVPPALSLSAAAQAAKPSDPELLRWLDQWTREKGVKDFALGRRTCERLGLTPVGDCAVFRFAAPRPAGADGFEHSIDTFSEPGTGAVRIIVFRQKEDEIYYYLCGLDGALVRAAYQNRSTAWYKVPNEDAQPGFEQELDFWRGQQGELEHAGRS